jgi:hypothetical protein
MHLPIWYHGKAHTRRSCRAWLRRAEATAPAALSRKASVPAPFDDVLQPLQTLLQRGELTDHFL